MSSKRISIASGAPWEERVGYCRAVRVGPHISVSGTAPVAPDGSVHAAGDAYAQAKRCIEIIEAALQQAGAGLEHVVRTRMFVTDISQWEDIGRAHGEAFGEVRPATSMVQVAALIDPDMLVEIEADAFVPGS
ncbi:MAG: RidA family protein [Woeseiaceae bacterium]|jgi:enamine deaminase RidA (YjgF/YER057c/UK114 family)